MCNITMTNAGNQIKAVMNGFPDVGKYRSKCVLYHYIQNSGRINKILLVYTDGVLIILKYMHLSDNAVPILKKI